MKTLRKKGCLTQIIPDIALLTQCLADDQNSIATQELLLEYYDDDPGKVPNVGILITIDGETTMKFFFKDEEGIQT